MAGNKPELKAEKVKDVLTRFPNTPKLTLAKKLYKENSLLFDSVENARKVIRYYTGKMGKYNKDNLQDRRFLNNSHNPYGLPESDETEWEPYILPKASNDILVLCDPHNPYHNIPAMTQAIKYGKERKINTVFLNGDVMDCYQISRFEKDPYKRKISGELEVTRRSLEALKNTFPNAKFYYKEGNHEERWEKFLKLRAPELFDLDEFRLDVLLRLRELGIEYIKDKRIVKAGKLNILHGHEFQSGVIAPVNVARGVFIRAKANTLVGHSHVTSEHTERDLNGDIITCWSVACLCELHPEYARINKWNHGFAHVQVNSDRTFNVNNVRIIRGKIV